MTYAYSITKAYSFAAAHKLTGHKGKCARLHGHNYKVEVTVSGPLIVGGSSDGMVVDFEHLDYCMKPLVESMDHTFLADGFQAADDTFLLGRRTTAENIAAYILGYLRERNLNCTRVRVYETDKAYADCEFVADHVQPN